MKQGLTLGMRLARQLRALGCQMLSCHVTVDIASGVVAASSGRGCVREDPG